LAPTGFFAVDRIGFAPDAPVGAPKEKRGENAAPKHLFC
jgi:hypothetical protein